MRIKEISRKEMIVRKLLPTYYQLKSGYKILNAVIIVTELSVRGTANFFLIYGVIKFFF